VTFEACSLARDGGAGTLRHPGTAIDDVAGWVAVPLVAVAVAVAVASAAAAVVEAEALTELGLELEELPHAASVIAAPDAIRSAAALPAPRRYRRSDVRE
jgi:hypothetical protein